MNSNFVGLIEGLSFFAQQAPVRRRVEYRRLCHPAAGCNLMIARWRWFGSASRCADGSSRGLDDFAAELSSMDGVSKSSWRVWSCLRGLFQCSTAAVAELTLQELETASRASSRFCATVSFCCYLNDDAGVLGEDCLHL